MTNSTNISLHSIEFTAPTMININITKEQKPKETNLAILKWFLNQQNV